MSDKVGPNKGPVPMHKALAAGESLKEAESTATGKSKSPSRNAK